MKPLAVVTNRGCGYKVKLESECMKQGTLTVTKRGCGYIGGYAYKEMRSALLSKHNRLP